MGSAGKKSLQQLYMLQLEKHPLATNVFTSGVLSAISDIVSQKLSGIQKLQVKTLLLKVLFGAAYFGPSGHYFHLLLEKLFKGKDTKTVAKKVVFEQVTISPLSTLLFMLYYGLVIDRMPWIKVKSKIKKEFPAIQYTSWTFWPVVGWINQKYVPLQLRVIFENFVGFAWGVFMDLQARTLALPKS